MNPSSLRRKALYVMAIVALFIPLYMLGQPPARTATASGGGGSPGGTLAQLRERYDFGQANLGQLDPASETMRLASLGLRGLAATILWQRAEHFKEEKYWDKLSATLNQLALLQPHFVSVWEQQAHNLSYNVSAEFDDYRQRYLWVKKGMDHLVRGTEFNRRQPLLQWHLGKYTTQKIGRSDEKKQFRELFRQDEPFHQRLTQYGLDLEQPDARGADRKPDNWLVGRLWFLKAYDLVQAGAPCKKTRLLFYGEAPLALMYYAEAIESEGVLDDRAIFAWSRAHDAWRAYGELDIPTTWNHTIRLRGLESARQAAAEAHDRFDAFTADVQRALIEENRDQVTPDEYAALTKAAGQRSAIEVGLAQSGLAKFMPPPLVIAQRMKRELKAKATELANTWQDKVDFAFRIDRYREMCNYGYWEALSELEQTPTAVAARRQLYDAEKSLNAGDLDKAALNYEACWRNWDKVFRKYPLILHDEVADRLLKSITRYADATNEGSLPEDFPLNWFVRYRAIRDNNKMGEETYQLYHGFVDAAATYEARLETPFEVESASSSPASPPPPASQPAPPTEASPTKSPHPWPAPATAEQVRPPRLEPPL
jgi:hypothetical protein